ncbi:MAG TPA: RNA methyltransferase [Acidimicrobiales bacterium]
MGSSHQRVRRLRRLVQKRSLRWSEGVCVLEGPDLVDAALESGVEFEAVYVDAGAITRPAITLLTQKAETAGVRVFALAEGVIEKIADAQTPQPVLAAARFEQRDVTSIPKVGLVLVLHDLRDPGNVGTIIRSADAAGATAVVVTGQSVDPFNPKTLRASAGSIFHLPVVVATIDETLDYFSDAQLLASVVRGGRSHRDVDFLRTSVVVIGNEADGLDAATIERCADSISIPMDGRSESLNAGIAASLIAFEALWQRRDAAAVSPPRSL